MRFRLTFTTATIQGHNYQHYHTRQVACLSYLICKNVCYAGSDTADLVFVELLLTNRYGSFCCESVPDANMSEHSDTGRRETETLATLFMNACG